MSPYVLALWPYYTRLREESPKFTWLFKTDSDVQALKVAETLVLGQHFTKVEPVGTLTVPDGRVVARRYVILHKVVNEDGIRVCAGTWQFFAPDDQTARRILEKKPVDWMNVLYGPDGLIA